MLMAVGWAMLLLSGRDAQTRGRCGAALIAGAGVPSCTGSSAAWRWWVGLRRALRVRAGFCGRRCRADSRADARISRNGGVGIDGGELQLDVAAKLLKALLAGQLWLARSQQRREEAAAVSCEIGHGCSRRHVKSHRAEAGAERACPLLTGCRRHRPHHHDERRLTTGSYRAVTSEKNLVARARVAHGGPVRPTSSCGGARVAGWRIRTRMFGCGGDANHAGRRAPCGVAASTSMRGD